MAPATATQYSEVTQTADLAVRGKGTAESAVQVLENSSIGTEQNSTVATEQIENNASVTSTVGQTTESAEQITITNNDPAPAEATGADTQIYDTTENLTIPQIDTSGIVMQSTDYSCGPAALATVLQKIGVNATEQELKVLAGTDNETGTSMYGLVRAAKAKGVNAVGMRLSVDELKRNHIVHVVLNGTPHYSVVREITENSVKLADPSKGNIVLSREEFSAIFTGNVLVISDPNMQVNQTETTNQTNITAPVSVQSENSQILTSETLQTIRGRGGRNRIRWRWWGRIIYICNTNTRRIIGGKATVASIISLFKVPKPIAVALFASAGVLYQVNIHNTGVRVWVTWMGHVLWIAAQRR